MAAANGADSRPWAQVDRDYIARARNFRSRHTFPVLCCYLSFTDRATGLAWPSKITVAMICGIRQREVRRCVEELLAAGILVSAGPVMVSRRKVIAYQCAPVPRTPLPLGHQPPWAGRSSTEDSEGRLPLGRESSNPTRILPMIREDQAAPFPEQDRPSASGEEPEAGEQEERLPEPGTYPDCRQAEAR